MQIEINGQPVTIPTTLQEFTLGQRIRFQAEHGNELDEQAKAIQEMEEGDAKSMEVMLFNFEKMLRTFSFFSGIDVEVLKESEFINDIASIYFSSMAVLFEQEENITLQTEYTWNNEVWCLYAPELKQGDKMTFGELIQAKQIVLDMQDVSNGHWETMLRLCAIFFRKQDEKFDKKFLAPGSERLKLMEQLPLEYALPVGFFLLSCLHSYLNISPYFNRHK